MGIGNFPLIASAFLAHGRRKTSPGSAGCAKSLCHSYPEITEPLAAPLPPFEILFSPTAGSRATRGAGICAAGTEIPSWHFAAPEINFSLGFLCSWLMPQKSSQDVQWAGPRGADREKQREILAPEPCPFCFVGFGSQILFFEGRDAPGMCIGSRGHKGFAPWDHMELQTWNL